MDFQIPQSNTSKIKIAKMKSITGLYFGNLIMPSLISRTYDTSRIALFSARHFKGRKKNTGFEMSSTENRALRVPADPYCSIIPSIGMPQSVLLKLK